MKYIVFRSDILSELTKKVQIAIDNNRGILIGGIAVNFNLHFNTNEFFQAMMVCDND